MRTTSKFLAVALTAAVQSAMAGTIPLNFEDQTTTAKLPANYKGVDVNGAAWGGASEAPGCGGTISFVQTGNCGALWLAVDPSKRKTGQLESFTMSLTGGFEGLSFDYSGAILLAGLSVRVFDAAGLDIGGVDDLGGVPCTAFQFCTWSPITLNFTGVARSVTFTAIDQSVLLDNITFTTPTQAGGQLPEPTSVALALGALGAAAWSRKRKPA